MKRRRKPTVIIEFEGHEYELAEGSFLELSFTAAVEPKPDTKARVAGWMTVNSGLVIRRIYP